MTVPMPLTTHQPKASALMEDRWASSAITAATCRDATALADSLRLLLIELQNHGYSPEEASEHPATALLVAQLAELSGLHFHYPSQRLWQCQQLRIPQSPPAPDAFCHGPTA